jgi:hypothetical protein
VLLLQAFLAATALAAQAFPQSSDGTAFRNAICTHDGAGQSGPPQRPNHGTDCCVLCGTGRHIDVAFPSLLPEIPWASRITLRCWLCPRTPSLFFRPEATPRQSRGPPGPA